MIPANSLTGHLRGVDVIDDGSGPVVALAHGAGGGVRANFDPLLAAGRDRHRFVGAHYPGAGTTPRAPHALELDDLADTVVAAGRSTGAERFPVVGLSLGAAVAVTAAVRHPEHVSALVLTVGLTRTDVQVRAVTRVWRHLADTGRTDVLAELLLYTASSPITLASMSTADADASVAEIARTYPTGGADHAELAARVDVTDLLPQVDVPTLVVVAGQDRIVLPDTTRLLATIPGAQLLELPDAGHIFTPTEADTWAETVLDFLDHLPR